MVIKIKPSSIIYSSKGVVLLTTCSIVQRHPLARCDGHICCKLWTQPCPQTPRKASPSSSICSSGGSPSQTSAMPPLSKPASCCCLCSNHTGFAGVHAKLGAWTQHASLLDICLCLSKLAASSRCSYICDGTPCVPCSGTADTHHSTAQYNHICTCCAVSGMISRSGCCSAK